MAQNPVISQRITLEGDDEILKQFARLAKAGESAFASIGQAAAATQKSFADLGNSMNRFGTAARTTARNISVLSLAVTGLAAGFVKLAKNAVDSADAIAEAAAAAGLTTDAFQELRAAAAQAGVDPKAFEAGMGALIKAAKKAEQEVAAAMLRMAERIGAGTKKAGIHTIEAAEGVGQATERINALATELQQKFRDLGKDIPLAHLIKDLTELKFGTAAQREEFAKLEGTTVDLGDGLSKLRALADGNTDALQQLGISLKRDADGAIDMVALMEDVAEALKNIPNEAERARIAMEIFGSKAGRKWVAFLAQGKQAIQLIRAEVLKLSADEIAASGKASDALTALGQTASAAHDKLFAVFAPAIEQAARGLAQFIRENVAIWQEWGQTIASQVTPYVTAFVELLGRVPLAFQSTDEATVRARENLMQWGNAAGSAATAISNAVTNVIIPALMGLLEVLNTVAQTINSVFGTQLTGADIAAAIVIAKIIGLFGLLNSAIGVVVSTLRVLGTLFGVLAAVVGGPVAIAIVALGVLIAGIIVYWDELRAAGDAVWAAIINGLQTAGRALVDFITTPIAGAWQWLVDTFNTAIGAIMTMIDNAITKLKELLGLGARVAPSTPQQGVGDFARGGRIGGRGSGTSDSNLAWVSRGEHIMPARVVRQPGVLAFLEALRRRGNLPAFAVGGTVGRDGRTIEALVDAAQRLLGAVEEIGQAMHKFFPQVVELDKSMAKVQQTILDVIKQLDESLGFARGGRIGGRGSGTSDSNLAWVSRGEYITPARAVRQPGVLAFLEALRRSGGNLRHVLDSMGRFALGGMVTAPALAGGGMSSVTIQFPGLPPITGLRASSEVVDELRKAAALAQVRSGGRKPSRYS